MMRDTGRRSRLEVLLTLGLISIEEGCYMGIALDYCNGNGLPDESKVVIGVVGEEEKLEQYLEFHPSPEDWNP